MQLSEAVRNARLDAIESTIGTTPILRIRTGSAPANCAASRSGTILATVNLPSDWMAAASGGAKALTGTWQDLSVDATGDPGHFEIMDSGGTVCHVQGTVSEDGGSGELQIDNGGADDSLTAGESFSITSFTITDGNA